MKRWVAILLIACLLTASAPALARPGTAAPGVSAKRLLALARLWGDVKYFDPQLAYRDVDWDGALLAAIPKVEAATTAAQYGDAVRGMLDTLHDPQTHLLDSDAQPDYGSDDRPFVTMTAAGSSAIVSLVGNSTTAYQDLQTKTTPIAARLAGYRTVIFDLRSPKRAYAYQSRFVETALEGPIGAGVVHGSLALPAQRTRSYEGFPSQSAPYVGSGGYSGYFRTADATTVAGTAITQPQVAFVVDARSDIPDFALAMVRAGTGTILADRAAPALRGDFEQLDIGEGRWAQFRTGEFADIAADAPYAQALPKNADAILAARTWLASHASATATPLPPPPPGHFRLDAAYPSPLFPDDAHRVLGIARIYNAVRLFWPYKALTKDDWDLASAHAIDAVRASTDARSYLLDIYAYYAHIHDSHGFIISPATFFQAGVPWTTRWLGGAAVVTGYTDAGRAESAGVRIGDVVSEIDGTPIATAIARHLPYIAASTREAAYRDVLANAGPSIYGGVTGTPIAVTLRHPGSRTTYTARIVRALKYQSSARSGPIVRILPGNVGYVDLDRLESSGVDAMFASLAATRAIVFDMRGYPHGTAWQIAPRLTTRSGVRGALFERPFVTGPTDTEGYEERLPAFQRFYQRMPATDAKRYLRPTVMLVDERTQSQAEHTGLFFEAANGTRFVGSPTAGANGDVTYYTIPGRITMAFTGQSVRHADGRQLQRLGLVPDVRSAPTDADIAIGNDVVLQAGLAEALRLSHVARAQHFVATERARERALFALDARTTRANIAAAAAELVYLGKSLPHATGTMPMPFAWAADAGTGSVYHRSSSSTGGQDGGPTVEVTGTLAPSGAEGNVYQTFDFTPYRGKTVHLFGLLRSVDVTSAGFFAQVNDSGGRPLAFDYMSDRRITGTRDWTPFSIVLNVPSTASKGYLGLDLQGNGSIYGSNLRIEIVPGATPSTGAT